MRLPAKTKNKLSLITPLSLIKLKPRPPKNVKFVAEEAF